MKYFKITNLTTHEAHYVTSTLPNESPTHVAMSAHLDPTHKYSVEEVSAIEFLSRGSCKRDFDIDNWDDDDWENFQ